MLAWVDALVGHWPSHAHFPATPHVTQMPQGKQIPSHVGCPWTKRGRGVDEAWTDSEINHNTRRGKGFRRLVVIRGLVVLGLHEEATATSASLQIRILGLPWGTCLGEGGGMATQLTEEQWLLLVKVFRASRARRGARGRDDRKFLEALHHLGAHNLCWRELPAEFGNWNSVWKRYWRWRQLGACDSFLAILAQLSETAHLVEIFKAAGRVDEPSLNPQGLDRAVGPPFLRSRA
jgi:transposase